MQTIKRKTIMGTDMAVATIKRITRREAMATGIPTAQVPRS